MIETDKEGYPLDLSNWPETEKLKNTKPGMDLVHKIFGSLHDQGCECFKGKFMLDVEAEIFRDMELFKGMDSDKLDKEMKEWRALVK